MFVIVEFQCAIRKCSQVLAAAGRLACIASTFSAPSATTTSSPGMAAAESLAHRRIGTCSAYLPSLQAAYGVGHTIVEALLREWPGSPITKNKQRERYSVAP